MTANGVKIHEIGTATVNLSGTKVGIGNSAIELLDQISQTQQLMMDLITECTNIFVPTAVGPSGNPLNSPAFLALKAQVAIVKGKVDTLKGSV